MNPIGLPPAAQWNVGGALPWGGGGNAVAAAASRNPGAVAGAYGQAYNSALAMNQSNYNNILSGYQRALSSQTTAQEAIASGYSNLYNDVIGKIQGIGQARSTEIDDASARNLASSSQQLIDRGLGNSTIQTAVNRGVETDRTRRQIENDESIAQMQAQYMSNLGLAGLGSREAQLRDTTGLVTRQLDWMDSVQSKYPDPGLYASLASQAGANRGNAGGGFGGGSFFGANGRPIGGLGYVPSPAPSYGGGGYGHSVGGGFGGSLYDWAVPKAAAAPATTGWASAPAAEPATDYAGMASSAALAGIYGGGQPDTSYLADQVGGTGVGAFQGAIGSMYGFGG